MSRTARAIRTLDSSGVDWHHFARIMDERRKYRDDELMEMRVKQMGWVSVKKEKEQNGKG